ncbi:uncharacterized protein LOC110704228 [Chenopodium quinoa]|uniref:uncharacterized protein LOC110704228 n=1 Tax=Chenopodium quinoa TaxID=63459 RepID=UPI000B78250E|nr:uncharacterized protein LOC110704228 [Chenopodium quinoa]
MVVSDKKFNEVMTHNKMLENQISQHANALKDHASPSSLPSQGLDPKIPVNDIIKRSGKVLEESFPRKSGTKEALVEDERNSASLSEVVIETPREQLHLSLPFTEVVTQMPNYAIFLKDILSGRRSCDVVETVNLTENCSAIIMNKMPPKLKDPGNFSIPCAINKMQIDNALCDL